MQILFSTFFPRHKNISTWLTLRLVQALRMKDLQLNNSLHMRSLRKMIVLINTSSRVRYRGTVFTLLIQCNSPLIEEVCLLLIAEHPLIMRSEDITLFLIYAQQQ